MCGFLDFWKKNSDLHTFTESKVLLFLEQGIISEMFHFKLLKKKPVMYNASEY